MGSKLKFIRVLICFIFIIKDLKASYNSYVYEITPVNSAFDMRCVLENVDFARAIKYQSESRTCEKLSVMWNKTPIFDSGYVYIWMKWYEQQFEETLITTLTIPDNFDVGYQIEVVIETSGVIQEGFNVNVRNSDGTIQYIHLNIKPSQSKAILNTKFNGTFDEGIHVPIEEGFANSTYTLYTISLHFQSTYWEVYTGDTFLSNFTNVHGFNGTGKVKFHSDDVYCKRMIFYVP